MRAEFSDNKTYGRRIISPLIVIFVLFTLTGCVSFSKPGNQNSLQLQFTTGLAYEALDNFSQAKTKYESVLAFRRPSGLLEGDTELKARSQLRLAHLYANHLLNPRKAINNYQLYISEFAVGAGKEAVLFELAQFCLDQKKYEQAIKTYTRLLEQFPGSEREAEVHYNLGEIYAKKDQVSKAIEEFKKLVEEFPRSGLIDGAYYKLAKIYGKRENYSAQLKYYRELITKCPDSDLRGYSLFEGIKLALKLDNSKLARDLFKLLKKTKESNYLTEARRLLSTSEINGEKNE